MTDIRYVLGFIFCVIPAAILVILVLSICRIAGKADDLAEKALNELSQKESS